MTMSENQTSAPETVEWWSGEGGRLSAMGIGEKWSARTYEFGTFNGEWLVRDASGDVVASGLADDAEAAKAEAERVLRDRGMLGVYPVEANPPLRMPRFTDTPVVRVSVPWDHVGAYPVVDPNGKRWDLAAGDMLVWYSHNSETVRYQRARIRDAWA